MGDKRIQWHPAFGAALRIELEQDREALAFEEEHLLGSKPLQIDMLVIKKVQDVHIHKSIGHIFRKYNIIEYKSPNDYLSADDFYKVCAYACLYKQDRVRGGEIDAEDVTISFVCSHYPQEMIQYIYKAQGIVTEKYTEGIFYLRGGMFAMQIVVNQQLKKEDYRWLQRLGRRISSVEETEEIIRDYIPHQKSQLYQAVMDVIVRANWHKKEGDKEMCEAIMDLMRSKTFMEMFKESDLYEDIIKDVQKEGERKGIRLTKTVFKLFAEGYSPEEIAGRCEVAESLVEDILTA